MVLNIYRDFSERAAKDQRGWEPDMGGLRTVSDPSSDNEAVRSERCKRSAVGWAVQGSNLRPADEEAFPSLATGTTELNPWLLSR